jgi:DnaJ-class molecular chaperone
MDLNINCYEILGLKGESTEKEIKKKYYKLSKTHHPDKKGGDAIKFNLINKAYTILSEERNAYDTKSIYGNKYNELTEFFVMDIDYDFESTSSKFEKVKNRESLDVYVKVDKDDFDGTIEFARMVKCKSCDGSGKDMSAKIIIRDVDGNIKQIFDADDGCDFCEGAGKLGNGNPCGFCGGAGKIGMKECSTCKGDRRILGKQKLKGITLEGDETTIKAMGNHSFYDSGKCGDLIIICFVKE